MRKQRLLFKMGTDFIMHNTGMFASTNNALFDAIWSMSQQSFCLYLLSGSDSPWRTRQIAASAYHFHRLLTTSAISAGDYGLSRLVNAILPGIPCFRLDSAKTRAFKRLMLTLKRNGGIYYDAYRLIAGLAPISVQYGDILKSSPFNCIEKVKIPTKLYIENLFRKELNMNVSDTFASLVTHSATSDGDVLMFTGHLHDGRAVSLSILPERRERMRNYDIFPFKLLEKAMSVIPSFAPERAVMNVLLNRLDFNLTKEQKARWQILERFGVDPAASIEKIFEDSRNIDLPVQVPAPIPHLCSRHIMVTDVQSTWQLRKSTPSLIKSLVKFTRKLSRNSGFIVPDMSLQNVRISRTGKVSLARYATLTQIDNADVEATGKLVAGMVIDNETQMVEAMEHLGIGYPRACQLSQEGNTRAIARAVMRARPEFVVGMSEAVTSLAAHANSVAGRRHGKLIDRYTVLLSQYGFKL